MFVVSSDKRGRSGGDSSVPKINAPDWQMNLCATGTGAPQKHELKNKGNPADLAGLEPVEIHINRKTILGRI